MPPPFRPGVGPGARPQTLGQTTKPVVSSITPNSGRVAGGAAITITGKHLDGSTLPVVTLGSTPATNVVVVNDTTITCNVGVATDAGLVDVNVTIGSEVGALDGGFTYYSTSVLAITPKFGPLAGGTTVLITGFNFVAGSTVLIGGVAATSVNVIDDQNISCVTPAHGVGFTDVVVTEPSTATGTLKNGFQFTLLTRGDDIRRQPGISIRDILNNTPNTCSFVVDGQSNVPTVGEEISIIDSNDGDRVLFAGNVQTVTQRYEDRIDQIVWDVVCTDFTWLLNKFRPIGNYNNVSASDIVTDLVAKFAPGFTSAHVQTNLTPISIQFDGSADFATCLSAIANAIGGGHWRVDYIRDVHFFHKLPPNIQIPELPQTVLRLGPGSAMTVSEGNASINGASANFPVGLYVFRTTFVYSNGVESAMGPLSNVLPCQGTNSIQFANIPIGAAAGALTCVKRRVYYKWYGPISSNNAQNFVGWSYGGWQKGFEVDDNVTTDLNNANSASTWVGQFAPYGLFISKIADSVLAPFEAYVAPPPKPSNILTATPPADFYTQNAFIPQAPLVTGRVNGGYAQGAYKFRYAYLYRDGSMSFPSDEAEQYTLVFDTVNGSFRNVGGTVIEQFVLNLMGISNLLPGPTINGVDVIARFIFGHYAGRSSSNGLWNIPEVAGLWHIVPDNTTTSVNIAPATAGPGPVGNTTNADTSTLPTWPWPDGPSLEDTDPPDDIDDLNTMLLRDGAGEAFTMTVDMSQLRNRVFVRGSGTTLADKALIGATQIKVSNAGAFSPLGGTIYAKGQAPIPYFGVSAGSTTNPNGVVYLSAPLGMDLDQGTSVGNFLQVDDVDSQKALGKAELDLNGNPTDGVHEYAITDGNLNSPIQLYMRAHAELELFGRPIISIRYSTRDPKTVAGQTVHVNLTNPPCQGDFLIQEVTIDQIHDENDQLAPRYTVSASSVRFELSDLLLQISQGKINLGSDASTGSASTSSAASATTTFPAPYARKIAWSGGSADTTFETTSAPTLHVVGAGGTAGVAATGSSTGITDTEGTWGRLTTTAAVSSEARVQFPNGAITAYAQHNPVAILRMRTGPLVSNMRFFFYLGNAVNVGNADTNTAALNMIGIKYSSTLGGGWVGYYTTAGSTAFTTTGPIALIAPSTKYTMKIRITGQVATFDVNGAVQTLNFPTSLNSIGLYSITRLLNDEIVNAKRFDWKTVYFEYD